MTILMFRCLGFATAKQVKPEPTTATATITLQEVDIGEILDKLEINIALRPAGKVTVKATMAVELGDATEAKAYTFRGSLTSDEIAVERMRVQKLHASLVYSGGKLALTELKSIDPVR